MKIKSNVNMIAEGIESEPDGNGVTVYFKDGERVEIYRERVEEVVALGLEKINTVFDVLTEMYEDPDGLQVQGLAYVGKELIESMWLKVRQHVKIVKGYYGSVAIDRAMYRQQTGIEGGLHLGVVITPKKGEGT